MQWEGSRVCMALGGSGVCLKSKISMGSIGWWGWGGVRGCGTCGCPGV